MAPNIGQGQMPPIDVRHATAQTSSAILSNRQDPDTASPAQPDRLGSGIVNQALTRIADNLGARSAKVIPVLVPDREFEIGWNMQRLRLKADGRIVELRDGREFPLAPAMEVAAAGDDVPLYRQRLLSRLRKRRRLLPYAIFAAAPA